MKYSLLFIFILIGCGQNTSQFSISGFESYYGTFVGKTNTSSNNIIIQLGDLSNYDPSSGLYYIGLCSYGQNPTVTIDQGYWSTASEIDRQELIDHELGHCILGRQHRNDTLPNGNPASIMNAYHFSGAVMNQSSEYYYHELVYGK